MNIILDLLGSSLIGGLIVLMMLNLNIFSTQKKHSSDNELRLQHNAKTLAEIMNTDLRKIGYGVDSTAFKDIQEKKFSFYADLDTNGTVDVVTYSMSDSTAASSTENPRDKYLYRIVNNDSSSGPSLGLVDIKFTYRNMSGNVTAIKDSIKYVEVEIWVETIEPVDNKYPFTYWEMKINPRNI